ASVISRRKSPEFCRGQRRVCMYVRLLLVPIMLVGVTIATARGQEPRVDPQGKADVQGKAQVNDPNAPKAGADAQANAKIRVETRGPVHEAFAQPFEKDPKP